MAPLLGASLAMVFALAVPQTDPPSLDDLVAAARNSSPRILAARLRADVARERIEPAGSLPDPMLTFGLLNRSIQDPTRSDMQMTMTQVMVSQRLPWWGRRELNRGEVAALASADAAVAREVEAAVVGRVRELYYEVAYMDRAATTLADTRELLRSFREVSESLYGVGSGLQTDVLQAQIAVAEVSGDLVLLAERRTAAVARLNALLGRAPDHPLDVVDLPDLGPALPSIDLLMERASVARPALAAARERIRAAESAREGARLNTRPEISLSAGYGRRGQYPDLASLSVGVSLPVFSASKQRPQQREAEALLLLRQAEEGELLNETYAGLMEMRAAAQRARELERLYATSILPQARAAVEAALSGYQVGRVDFMTLLSTQTTVNRFETERLRLIADHHIAVAGIEAFIDTRLEDTAP